MSFAAVVTFASGLCDVVVKEIWNFYKEMKFIYLSSE